ncbi:MAG: hypothetical protein LC754_16530 [Acidobacteria bacterium]|nr:hypothetical protein [Acidobacteriota bacterium]
MTQQRKRLVSLPGNPFVGKWTYRSFKHIADMATDLNELKFAIGMLAIDDSPLGSFSGQLTFSKTSRFKLNGSSSFGNPFTVRFQGVGNAADSKGQIYDYVGYLEPLWPDGINQVPAIVGSVIRTVPHDGKPSGVVASWIAVKQL